MWFSFWPVLIAALASFVLGFLWYGPLFGKTWMALQGITQKQIDSAKKKGMASEYIATFLGSFVTATVLQGLIKLVGISTAGGAIAFGVMVWLGFIATTTLGSVLWEGKPFALYMLNNGHSLVSFIVMSLILTIW